MATEQEDGYAQRRMATHGGGPTSAKVKDDGDTHGERRTPTVFPFCIEGKK